MRLQFGEVIPDQIMMTAYQYTWAGIGSPVLFLGAKCDGECANCGFDIHKTYGCPKCKTNGLVHVRYNRMATG